MSDKPPLLVIAGPTGVGKTAAAVALAARLPIEVVSADSRQVYRGMDVATGKPTAEERATVPHHLIDVVEPDDTYDAARFAREARAAIDAIRARGRLPVVVGGTGFYIRALVRAGRRSGRGLCRSHPRPRAPRRAPALPCRGDGRRRPRGGGARAARARLRADAARDAGHRLSRVRARRRRRSRARRGAATDAAGHAALRAAAVDVVRARARALDRRRGRAGRRHRRGGRDRDDTRAGGPDRVRQRVNGGNRGGHEVGRERERAILAALRRPAQRRAEVEESLEELAGLTAAAGATVGQRVIQERQAATSSLYFGSGKVDEMAEAVRESGANLFI